jgi:hypothetical protein
MKHEHSSGSSCDFSSRNSRGVSQRDLPVAAVKLAIAAADAHGELQETSGDAEVKPEGAAATAALPGRGEVVADTEKVEDEGLMRKEVDGADMHHEQLVEGGGRG